LRWLSLTSFAKRSDKKSYTFYCKFFGGRSRERLRVFIQLLLSPKEVAKKSARFSKRGKESSTVIDNSNFVTTLAQCVVFGARGFGAFRLAIQSFSGLPQSANLL